MLGWGKKYETWVTQAFLKKNIKTRVIQNLISSTNKFNNMNKKKCSNNKWINKKNDNGQLINWMFTNTMERYPSNTF